MPRLSRRKKKVRRKKTTMGTEKMEKMTSLKSDEIEEEQQPIKGANTTRDSEMKKAESGVFLR